MDGTLVAASAVAVASVASIGMVSWVSRGLRAKVSERMCHERHRHVGEGLGEVKERLSTIEGKLDGFMLGMGQRVTALEGTVERHEENRRREHDG